MIKIDTSGIPADSIAMNGEKPKTLLDHQRELFKLLDKKPDPNI